MLIVALLPRQSCNLNVKQRQVLDLAMNGHNVFIGGAGGTGKTFTVKKLVELLSVTKNASVTCTTGMACGLYDNAITLHSFVGLNLQGKFGDSKKNPFGGIQVIVAGDFRQLPLVSNDIDEGQYCFESPLWNIMFPHCVELTEVYRQSQKAFVAVLKQLSSGEVTDETAAFIEAELDDKH
ncbi:ATP-dependent DNA helicase PIF1 [Paramuricea clavata]|uniref:ATP-dependent DNA helicase n=1 Tax=Paramuricea clavata TaxID=317549 RepID=A0A7D9JX52_PARCT|nr:ATP-dependent DNA helicase PIF1 [Paramuricea clavata]